jgi:hypothetical protein
MSVFANSGETLEVQWIPAPACVRLRARRGYFESSGFGEVVLQAKTSRIE